ncbi:MAG: tail fiber domain-containing protein [Candidatus Omnitrophica bacterium]|jgi:hypothetical protein|nr:tail fiber domain-containing protein [Candidatus Omnitrophota bacterium]MDD5725528.1 tail fiber domain-containing protein [Candidatus Omnitrophota bacterium]
MSKHAFYFTLSFLLFFCPVFLFAEEITITSYYPSPYGVYNELRAKKMAIGDNYIDSGNYTWESSDGDGGEVDYNADLVVEGNVGIGTTSPNRRLEVKDAVVFNSGNGNLDSNDITFLKNSAKLLIGWNRSRGAGEADFINNRGGGSPGGFRFIDYANDGTETVLVTMLGSGYVGIGTVSPTSTLHVIGDVYASGSITASSCCSTSDKRYKENIVILNHPLEKLLRLRGVKFDWKQKEFKDKNFPSGRQIGIIAQEMENEFPELVMTDKEGYKSIAYDKFTAVLLEAVKEQEKKINSLQDSVNILKSRLDKLEKSDKP